VNTNIRMIATICPNVNMKRIFGISKWCCNSERGKHIIFELKLSQSASQIAPLFTCKSQKPNQSIIVTMQSFIQFALKMLFEIHSVQFGSVSRQFTWFDYGRPM